MQTDRPFRGIGGQNGPLWPDPERGPFAVVTHWAEVDGHLACVGLSLTSVRLAVEQSDGSVIPVGQDVAEVRSGQLRRVPWQKAMDGFRDGFGLTVLELSLDEGEYEAVRDVMQAAGVDLASASLRDWLDYMTPDQKARGFDWQPMELEPPPPKKTGGGGRRSSLSEQEWAERAEVYVVAVKRNQNPNKELASTYGVSVEKARNWSAALRRKGYPLPMPSRGNRTGGPKA